MTVERARVDIIGVGHIPLFNKQGSGDSCPSKEGGTSRRFGCCGCFPFPFPWGRGSSWSDDELLPNPKDLRFGGGVFLGGVRLGGGTAGGLGFSAGASFAGVALRGMAGVGGLVQPTTGHQDVLVSTPLPHQLPHARPAGAVGRPRVRQAAEALALPQPGQDCTPRWGLSFSSWCRADKAMLNSAVPNLYRLRTPATSGGFTSTSTTCDSAIHKCVHKMRS